MLSCACSASFHVECLAQQLSEQQGSGAQGAAQQVLPEQGRCPCCAKQLLWIDLLAGMQSYGWATPKRRAPGRRRCGGRFMHAEAQLTLLCLAGQEASATVHTCPQAACAMSL